MPKRLTDEEKVRRARLKYLAETGYKEDPLHRYGQHKWEDKYYMLHRKAYSMVIYDEHMEDIVDGGELSYNIGAILPREIDLEELCFVDLEELQEAYKEKKKTGVVNLIKIKGVFFNVKLFMDVAKCVDAEEVCVYRKIGSELFVHTLEGRFGKALVCPMFIHKLDENTNLIMEVA